MTKLNEFKQYAKPQEFGKFLLELIEELGYKIKYQNTVNDNYIDIELTYMKSNKKERYICSIKYYSKLYFFSSYLLSSVSELSNILSNGEIGLLITNSICTDEYRHIAHTKNIIILDIKNLLYLVKPNENLYQKFLELLDFSIANIEPKAPTIPYSINNEKTKKDKINWPKKFKNIEPGKNDFIKYENLCIEALKIIFSDYLSIWERQQKSNDNLYRFDLICKIKNNISDDFFETLNNYFNTKYIVFDFKNYTEEITQKEYIQQKNIFMIKHKKGSHYYF